MRLILFFFLLLSCPAFAQNAVPAAAKPAVADWKSLGQPLADDTKPMMDRYVYNNIEATDQKLSVAVPGLSQDDIREWLNEHLAQILTLDGKSYDRKVYDNRVIFTPNGYAEYVVYLRSANFAKFLKDNNYKVTSYVDGQPAIISEGVTTENGKTPTYHWKAKAIMVLSYLDYRNQIPMALFKDKPKDKIDNRLPIQANIELVRIPVQKDGTMIAIHHLSFSAPEKGLVLESLDQR